MSEAAVKKKWSVEVRRMDGGEVVKTIDCHDKSLRTVEKVERGVTMNMDLDNFYTRIVDQDGNEPNEGDES